MTIYLPRVADQYELSELWITEHPDGTRSCEWRGETEYVVISNHCASEIERLPIRLVLVEADPFNQEAVYRRVMESAE